MVDEGLLLGASREADVSAPGDYYSGLAFLRVEAWRAINRIAQLGCCTRASDNSQRWKLSCNAGVVGPQLSADACSLDSD